MLASLSPSPSPKGLDRLLGVPDYRVRWPALVRHHFLTAYQDAGGLVAGAPMPVGQFGCTQARAPRAT